MSRAARGPVTFGWRGFFRRTASTPSQGRGRWRLRRQVASLQGMAAISALRARGLALAGQRLGAARQATRSRRQRKGARARASLGARRSRTPRPLEAAPNPSRLASLAWRLRVSTMDREPEGQRVRYVIVLLLASEFTRELVRLQPWCAAPPPQGAGMENMDGIFPDMPEHVKRILTEVLDNGPRGQAPSHSKKMFELLESGREDITAQELREAVETTGVHFPVWDGALKLILERVCKKWGIELAWTATPDAPTAHGLMLSQREAEAFERTTGNTGMHWVQVGYDQMPMFIAALSVVFSLWSRTANPSNTAKIFEMIDNLALNGTITLMPKASGHVRVHVDSKAYECDPKSRELMLGLRTDQLEDQLTNPNAIRALIENHRDDPATIYKTLEASFMVWALNHAEVAEWVEAGQKQLQGASDDE